jgi:hypothetical protein
MNVQEISICFSTPIRATGTAPLECRAVGMRGRTTDSTGPSQRSLRMERLCTTRCGERLPFCYVCVLAVAVAVADNPCVRNDCALPGVGSDGLSDSFILLLLPSSLRLSSLCFCCPFNSMVCFMLPFSSACVLDSAFVSPCFVFRFNLLISFTGRMLTIVPRTRDFASWLLLKPRITLRWTGTMSKGHRSLRRTTAIP